MTPKPTDQPRHLFAVCFHSLTLLVQCEQELGGRFEATYTLADHTALGKTNDGLFAAEASKWELRREGVLFSRKDYEVKP